MSATEPRNEAQVEEDDLVGRSWDDDALADEMSKESFPTSDPPSTWAGETPGQGRRS